MYEMENKIHVWNYQPWYIPKYLPTVFLLVPCLFLNLAGHSPVHQARDGPLTVACAQVEFVKQQMFAGETPSLFQKITFIVGEFPTFFYQNPALVV